MKNYKYSSILFLFVVLLAFACTDEDRIRIPEFEEALSMRIVPDPDFQTFDATDVPNAIVRLNLYTETDNIETVEIFGEYYNLQSDSLYTRVLLRTITGSDFSSDGIINDYDISVQEIVEVNQIELDLVQGGDRVDLYNVTTLTDGRVYPSTVDLGNGNTANNVTPNILNAAATTSFTTSLSVYVACPIDLNFGTGNYMLEQVSGPADPFFGGTSLWTTGVVNVASVNPIQRTFTAPYVTLGASFQFFLVCGQILVPKFPIGIGCGAGITYEQIGELSYDENDDIVFIFNVMDNVDGDCGLGSADVILKLTKIP